MRHSKGALAGVRILDLTDERAIYGAKLLADLGADVVRPEPPSGDPMRRRGPHLDGDHSDDSSLWHAFFASNRRFLTLDPDSAAGRRLFDDLAAHADILLTCDGGFCTALVDRPTLRAKHPDLVIINTSSFGTKGPWRDFLAPDLVAAALGGFCATTGDVDTPPLKGHGDLCFMTAGAYVAIAGLAALFHAREGGKGQAAEVSVHESIASCLEHVFMWYWYAGLLPIAQGKVLPRRGSLHWSNAYQVMKARRGSIMITPTPDAEAQILWLVENDLHEDLLDEKYREPENLPLLMTKLMDILRRWVATRDAEELFFEAQARHAPYGWVVPLRDLADNPQLEARKWWAQYRIGKDEYRGPGMPYRFSETPWAVEPSERLEPGVVVDEIGWGELS